MPHIRQHESSQQLKDEHSKLKGLAVLEKDFDRAEAIESEGQRRSKSAAKDLENKANALQARISARNQSFRDEKEKLEKRVAQLQNELSVAENRHNELNNVLESITKINTRQIYDYHQKIKTLNQEIAQNREWIRRQDEDLKSKDERIKRQDEDLKSKDREIEKMNKEKEKEKDIRTQWEVVDVLALRDNLVRDGDICGLSVA